MILDRLAEELAELGVVEQRPTQDGRNMTMMLGPSKAVLAGRADGTGHAADGGDPAVDAAATIASSDGAAAAAPAEVSPDGAVEVQVEAPAEVSPDGVVEVHVEAPAEVSPDGVVEVQVEAPADAVVAPSDSHNGASDPAVS
jgi:translation initiation factor IF-3